MPAEMITDWDVHRVQTWLISLGFGEFATGFLDNAISGEVLIHVNHDALRDLGMTSVGKRLTLLRAVWQRKSEDGLIGDDEESYIPPSEQRGSLYDIVQEQDERIRYLEMSYAKMYEAIEIYREELASLQKRQPPPPTPTLTPTYSTSNSTLVNPLMKKLSSSDLMRQDTFKWSTGPPKSSTSTSSPSGLTISTNIQAPSPRSPKQTPSVTPTSALTQSSQSSNTFKSFKVTPEDPCYKVLPAALVKYKINDDWRNYALFIVYNKTERCLSLDDQPLRIFQHLKSRNQNPVFTLRHKREMPSPIVSVNEKIKNKGKQPQITKVQRTVRDLEGEINDMPTSNGLLSPTLGDLPSPAPITDASNPMRAAQLSRKPGKQHSSLVPIGAALAIYPYVTDSPEELDVAIDDSFIILRKDPAKRGWIVQRDPNGTGLVDLDAPAGLVPSGCLLETTGPNQSKPKGLVEFASASASHAVLLDYTASGPEEIDLKEGQKLNVYKKFLFWHYAVKVETGERGWAPAWHLCKARSGTGEPSPLGSNIPVTSLRIPDAQESESEDFHMRLGQGLMPSPSTATYEGASPLREMMNPMNMIRGDLNKEMLS